MIDWREKYGYAKVALSYCESELNAAKRERDILRAVLEGMEFQDIDVLLDNGTVKDGRRLGELAKQRIMELTNESRTRKTAD